MFKINLMLPNITLKKRKTIPSLLGSEEYIFQHIFNTGIKSLQSISRYALGITNGKSWIGASLVST